MVTVRSQRFDVFLSHNSAEKADVEILARKLQRAGLDPWLDTWRLEAGKPWVDQLASGLAASGACAFFVGAHDIGDWAREEYYFAQDRAAKDHDFRLFPVLLPGLPDPFDFNALPPFLRMRTAIDFRCDIDEDRAFHLLVRAIKGLPLGAEGVEERAEDVCPYRGLEVFDEEHAEFFFGRDADVQHLIEKLKESRFLAVLGPSGTGKSSVVRAGLVPALRADGLPGSQTWTIRVFTPTAAPLTVLSAQLAQLSSGESMQKTVDLLREDERSLHFATALALTDRPSTECILWVVDQFEEAFTLCHDEGERALFLANLVYAASAPGGRDVVVLTMRADFYPRCAAYPGLAQQLAAQQYLVSPMDREGLLQVIVEPAVQVGLELEPGLAETILNEVQSQPGALPLLEFALLELWKRRSGRRLTLQGYTEAGGVHSAIATTADSVYMEFTPQEQDIARRILLRLTQPGEGTEDTRRRAAYDELISASAMPHVVDEVVTKLVRERLLTTSSDASTQGRWVDVSHEALIRGWPLLRQWIEQDREGLRELRRLTGAAQEWERHSRDDGYLYRGASLATAVEWRKAHDATLNELEEAFLRASVDLRDREEDAEHRREQQELEAARAVAEAEAQTQRERAEKARALATSERRRARVTRLFTGGLAVLLIAAAVIAVVALQARSSADSEMLTAQADQVATESSAQLSADPDLGLLLAREAVRIKDTVQSETALRQALADGYEQKELLGHTGVVWSARFSPDGNYVVTASDDRTVRVWDAHTGRTLRILRGHTAAVKSASFSPDGSYVVTASNDTTARVWDWRTGRTVKILHESGGFVVTGPQWVLGAAFSSNGRYIATANEDGSARVWDWRAGKAVQILQGHKSSVRSAAFSSDGKYIATASNDGTVIVWDWRKGTAVRTLAVGEPVNSAAFSPDGTYLVATDDFSTVRVWDWRTAKIVKSLSGHADSVRSATFSPDGNYVVTASKDKTARVWNWREQSTIAIFREPSGHLLDAAFSPDGRFVVTGDADDTSRVWRVPTILIGHRQFLASASFSPDGRYAITASNDGTARVWNWRTGRTLGVLSVPHPYTVASAAFAPDEKYVVTASYGDSARVWNWHSGKVVRSVTEPDLGGAAVFSPNGRYLATVSQGPTAYVDDWRGRSGAVTLQGHIGSVTAVAFSPDGRYLVTSSGDYTARVWDWRRAKTISILRGHTDWVWDAAFSPDGQYVVTASGDDTARVWDWGTGGTVSILRGHTGQVNTAVFSPDGRYVLTASRDSTVRVWDWPTERPLVTFAAPAESATDAAFSPDGRYIIAAYPDGTAQIYNWGEIRPGTNLLRLADERTTRQLTAQERQSFLP